MGWVCMHVVVGVSVWRNTTTAAPAGLSMDALFVGLSCSSAFVSG
jgi:hypothetical protein